MSAIIIKAVVRTVASSPSGDYVNSKEYRKPEWVTRMEEIQKRLSGKCIAVVCLVFLSTCLLVDQDQITAQFCGFYLVGPIRKESATTPKLQRGLITLRWCRADFAGEGRLKKDLSSILRCPSVRRTKVVAQVHPGDPRGAHQGGDEGAVRGHLRRQPAPADRLALQRRGAPGTTTTFNAISLRRRLVMMSVLKSLSLLE